MKKQEILNEIFKLQVLERQGINVRSLIQQLEEELWEESDRELDAKKANETGKKRRKEVNK